MVLLWRVVASVRIASSEELKDPPLSLFNNAPDNLLRRSNFFERSVTSAMFEVLSTAGHPVQVLVICENRDHIVDHWVI